MEENKWEGLEGVIKETDKVYKLDLLLNNVRTAVNISDTERKKYLGIITRKIAYLEKEVYGN